MPFYASQLIIWSNLLMMFVNLQVRKFFDKKEQLGDTSGLNISDGPELK